MNNDLISREALKKEIMECMTAWDEHSDYGQGRLRSYEWVIPSLRLKCFALVMDISGITSSERAERWMYDRAA